MTRVVVAGALANKPGSGGEAWVRLTWILGLLRLGVDVRFVEELARETATDAAGHPASFQRSVHRAWFRDVTRSFGLDERSALVFDEGNELEGPTHAELAGWADSADLLVNISGHLRWPELRERFRTAAYIDLDPGFTQIWAESGQTRLGIRSHQHHFSVGENIGTPGCTIPTGEIDWKPLPPPVTLDDWPVRPGPGAGRFTTVATWRCPFGPVTHGGRTYGLKVHEFRKLLDLPVRTGHGFELALDIHAGDAADRDALVTHGWRVRDPRTVASGPGSYRSYVSDSTAEFSVAQGVYVDTDSGWFSDRTTRYLAAGRPALVQDTGFSRNYPTGAGLVAFRTPEEAVEGARRIHVDYELHRSAARELAETRFAAASVLRRFLGQVGIPVPTGARVA